MNFFISRVYFYIYKKLKNLHQTLFEIWCMHQFQACGKNFKCHHTASLLSLNRITVGDNFSSGPHLRLRAYTEFQTVKYHPKIEIGNNFYAASDCYIAAVRHIKLGDNVTFASRCTVIDHAHGVGDYSDINTPVMLRKLGVKGDIIIEDNVWLCEGVVVLSGVRIGKNSIIGANAVVTKDIPANSIAVGIPAKVIKTIQR